MGRVCRDFGDIGSLSCVVEAGGRSRQAVPVPRDGAFDGDTEVVPEGTGRPLARFPLGRFLFQRPPARTRCAAFTATGSPMTTT